jgi:lipid-binding SYLF domain-containing protein
VKYRAIIVAMGLCVLPVHASWDEIKDSASDLGSAIGDTSKDAWDSVSDFSKETWESGEAKLDEMLEPETPEDARKALNTMSDTALARLFDKQPSAKVLFDSAYGYAVFDSRKFSLMLHTNQGAGVAVNRKTNKRTYMKMFGAGLAAGIGGKFYQQIIFFEDQKTFDGFVKDGWEATSEMGAIAGTESAELTAKYNGGMAIYQIGEKGLLLDANVSGSKYWIDTDLTQ